MSIPGIYTYSKFRTSIAVLLWAAISLFGTAIAQSAPQATQPKSTQPGTSTAARSALATSTDADENDENDADIPPFARGKMDKATYLRLRDEHVAKRRGIDDLMTNPQARSQAIQKMERQEQLLLQRKQGLANNASGVAIPLIPVWAPLGPDPIPNGQTDPNLNVANELPVSGRVTAIAIDQTDTTGNTVYVGTAQGGVYRTLDGGTTWTPMMDTAQSLAIGAITVDPLNHNTVFVGTGEGNLSSDSFFGVGLYVITNATTTANLAGPFNAPATSPNSDGFTDVFTGRSITQILVNPTNDNQILVSTSSGVSGLSSDVFKTLPTRGVYFSTNALSGSPTFTRSTIQTSAKNRLVTDMTMDPGNANTVLVHVFGNAIAGDGGVWMSTGGNPWNGTATWTQELIEISDNGKFAVNRVGNTTTFLIGLDQVPANTNSEGTLFSSTNGTTWTEVTAARGFCGGQCFYDMPIALDPTNAQNIYVGGSAGANIGAGDSGIFGKSTNGGTSFSTSQNFLHADSHAIAVLKANPSVIYAGNDGGIFASSDAGATWHSINGAGFNATQFESLAVHSTDPNFTIGGTQDNGTELLQPSGSWFRADFGDGGYSAIDQSTSSTSNVNLYHTYFNATNDLIGYAFINTGVTAAENTWNFSGCLGTPGNGINCTDNVLFYAPLTLGPGTPNTVYFGTDRLYRSADGGNTNVIVSQGPLDAVNGFPVSAIGISPQDDNVRIVGLVNGHVFATSTGSATLTDVTGGWPAKYVARVVIDPNVKTTAYVTLDGYGATSHIWKTTNLSATTPTWIATGFNIDVPVNAFTVDPASSNLYAGTDIGVYSSTDGGLTWNPYGTGLPRVAVFDLAITAGHKVRIATHGRGMWEAAAVPIHDDATTLTTNLAKAAAGTTINLTANLNTLGGVNAPTGTLTISDGTTVLTSGTPNVSGNVQFSSSSLASGPHNLIASYSGDANYPSSVSSPIEVDIVTTSSTAIAASSTNTNFGTPITLTATVPQGKGLPLPTGRATFLDGINPLGSPFLDATGKATLQISTLNGGVHTITAVYQGDGFYRTSTSVAVVITVINPDFTLPASSGSASVKAGSPATFTINIGATGGFNGTVNFACSGLPALTSCSFNPATVTGSGSTTLTISTTAATAASPASNSMAMALFGGAGLFGVVLAAGVPRKKRALKSALLFFGALALVGAMVSCGGGNNTPPPVVHTAGTPAGTSTVTVSATSGSTTHTSTITLTVQ